MDYRSLNDYELVYQVRENDDVAYNAIIYKYSNLVNMLVKKYIKGNRHLGLEEEDLYQAGMLGILMALNDYNSKDSIFYTYALLCAKREIEKLLKASSRVKNKPLNDAISLDKNISCDSIITLSEMISSKVNIESDYIINENCKKIYDIKYDLPIIESAILELKINGFKSKEISELLDITDRTVGYYLRKIKNKIKNVLN